MPVGYWPLLSTFGYPSLDAISPREAESIDRDVNDLRPPLELLRLSGVVRNRSDRLER